VDHEDFRQRHEYLASFNIISSISSPSWPKPCSYYFLLDLSAGILDWIKGWGYDIYMRKYYPVKRFKIEFYPDARIKNIIAR
jgi:hypothetical protein